MSSQSMETQSELRSRISTENNNRRLPQVNKTLYGEGQGDGRKEVARLRKGCLTTYSIPHTS